VVRDGGARQLRSGEVHDRGLGDHRGADGTERHSRGVADEGSDDRRQGPEAGSDEERGSECDRGAEPGGALEEEREEPGDQQACDARVGVQAGETGAEPDRGTGALLEVVDTERWSDDRHDGQRDERRLRQHPGHPERNGEGVGSGSEVERRHRDARALALR
jgi:hypothetical protein